MRPRPDVIIAFTEQINAGIDAVVPVFPPLFGFAASRDVGKAITLEALEAGFAIYIGVAITFALLEPLEPVRFTKELRKDPVVHAPLQGGNSDGYSEQVAEGDNSHHSCSILAPVLAPVLALVVVVVVVVVVVALMAVVAGFM